jgi:hypothetical protein
VGRDKSLDTVLKGDLTVYVPSVVYTNHKHEQDFVVNLINDPVVPNPNPPGILLGFQLDAPWRPWIISQSARRLDNPPLNNEG